MEGDAVVHDYLGRLEAAAWPLSADRRRELVGEVREHIDAALSDAGSRDEVTVRNVLDHLGAPEEIVAAEFQGEGGTGHMPQAVSAPLEHRGVGAVEIVAILLLTVGAFLLPVVGPALGLIFVWLSTQWSTRQKVMATAIAVVLFLLPIILLLGVNVGSA